MGCIKKLLTIIGGIVVVLFVAGMFLDDDESEITPASEFYGTDSGAAADEEASQSDEGENAGTEQGKQTATTPGGTSGSASVTEIDGQTFMSEVANYTNNKRHYVGDMPCVVDFYAAWCGPCKQLSPIMEKMAKKYAGKVKFYKIDIDAEPDLTEAYNIQSIPTLFFCSDGEISAITGAPSQSDLDTMIARLCQ